MKTFLLVPTAEGIGLTSACLGMIHAFDCIGVKANFLKPFAQEKSKNESRTSTIISSLYQRRQVPPIDYKKTQHMVSIGEMDELLEEAAAEENARWKSDVIKVEIKLVGDRPAGQQEPTADHPWSAWD